MFQNIDWFLLSHFEKRVCHPLQRLTGKTNYYFFGLCNFLIVLIFLGAYFDIFPKNLVAENGMILNTPLRFWLTAFFFAVFASVWRLLERRAYDRLSHNVANPLKLGSIWCFCRFLAMALLLPIALSLPLPSLPIYDKVFVILLTLVVFLLACDPLPPCKGKIKEWLNSFGKKPALVAVKTGE